MFRMKRTRCIALALLVAVSLLLPLPASAGGFWEKSARQGWEVAWAGLLGWLGMLPSVEASSAMIDPLGQPNATPPSLVTGESSSSIDPLGQPAFSDYSSFIDPLGNP